MSSSGSNKLPTEASPTTIEQRESPPIQHSGPGLLQRLQVLDNDSRLELTVQLWKSLPDSHRAAMRTLIAEDGAGPQNIPDDFVFAPPSEPKWTRIRRGVFSADTAEQLYAAPRRFDLATIFVVTAAYALMLGGLTALDAPASLKIAFSVLAAAVAIAQAAFHNIVNPRGVSIITGIIVCTLLSFVLMHDASPPLAVSVAIVFYCGAVGGSIVGYLMGTLVGGIFLLADAVRRKSAGRKTAVDTSTDDQDTMWPAEQ